MEVAMSRSPHAFCWIDGLCYWIKLSVLGCIISMSSRGFFTQEEAQSDFDRWYG
jgi:hypothetical protein